MNNLLFACVIRKNTLYSTEDRLKKAKGELAVAKGAILVTEQKLEKYRKEALDLQLKVKRLEMLQKQEDLDSD